MYLLLMLVFLNGILQPNECHFCCHCHTPSNPSFSLSLSHAFQPVTFIITVTRLSTHHFHCQCHTPSNPSLSLSLSHAFQPITFIVTVTRLPTRHFHCHCHTPSKPYPKDSLRLKCRTPVHQGAQHIGWAPHNPHGIMTQPLHPAIHCTRYMQTSSATCGQKDLHYITTPLKHLSY